jgi:hypothetical protein
MPIAPQKPHRFQAFKVGYWNRLQFFRFFVTLLRMVDPHYIYRLRCYKTGLQATVIFWPWMEKYEIQTGSTKIKNRLERYLGSRHKNAEIFFRKMKAVSVYARLGMKITTYSKFQA